jgi:sodium-dependent dicarboxylate transporter 2/3/5
MANLYKGQNPMIAALFVAGLPVFFLTMTGSITALTSVVYPIVLSFLALTRASDRYSEATLLLLGEAATAGAMLFLISTPPNLIAKQVIESNVPGLILTFFDWFIVGTVQAVIGLLIVWIIVFAVLGVKKEHSLEKLQEIVIQERAKLTPMSIREKIVLGVFLFALFLWLIPGLFNIAANLDPNL